MSHTARASRRISGAALLTMAMGLLVAGVVVAFLPLVLLGGVLLVVAVANGHRSRRAPRWVVIATDVSLIVFAALGVSAFLASRYGHLGD
ncbi:MAG: hypothetical protein NVS3B26_27960 [Mycobacteriales bacterium]